MKSKNNPKVSVIIGTYNRCDKLKRCVDSILNQDYNNIEIIIVNDNSTDKTELYLKKLKLLYPEKIIYKSNQINRGISYNSNLGFSYSKGDFIALIGDDDYWHDHQKISKQIEAIITSNSNIICSWWYEKDENDLIREKCPKIDENIVSRVLSRGGLVCGSTPLIRRSAWIEVGGFDEKMRRGTDSDFFRRIIIQLKLPPIIQEHFTTTVDVSGTDRMTNNKLKSNIKNHLISNNRTIVKFWKVLLFNPKALISRLSRSLKLMIKYVLT